jgi:xanthine dehydrogenase accessory factor
MGGGKLAVVRGAGDLATAVGRRLHLCGFAVVHLEVPRPAAIRRAVAFASAIYDGTITVEGVTAELAQDGSAALEMVRRDRVPVMVDPEAKWLAECRPRVMVDATMAKGKRVLPGPTVRSMADYVVGLGPGFTAGADVHAVVETQRGHDLGRVITAGSAAPYTGMPGEVSGAGVERVLRSPGDGVFTSDRSIGDEISKGEAVAFVNGEPVVSAIGGVLRGLLFPGLAVRAGQKVGDVDPSGERRRCFTISDKANAVAGGVLEAVFSSLAGERAGASAENDREFHREGRA